MTTEDDPDSINFEGTYEFIKGPYTCKDTRRKSGESGSTSLALEEVHYYFRMKFFVF